MPSFRFGVDSFIWAENFTEKDVWIVEKAKSLGFEYLDLAIAHPETFPVAQVKAEIDRTGIIPVTSTTLGRDTNLVSPDPAVRRKGVESLKLLVDINYTLGSAILGGVNYAGWVIPLCKSMINSTIPR